MLESAPSGLGRSTCGAAGVGRRVMRSRLVAGSGLRDNRGPTRMPDCKTSVPSAPYGRRGKRGRGKGSDPSGPFSPGPVAARAPLPREIRGSFVCFANRSRARGKTPRPSPRRWRSWADASGVAVLYRRSLVTLGRCFRQSAGRIRTRSDVTVKMAPHDSSSANRSRTTAL